MAQRDARSDLIISATAGHQSHDVERYRRLRKSHKNTAGRFPTCGVGQEMRAPQHLTYLRQRDGLPARVLRGAYHRIDRQGRYNHGLGLIGAAKPWERLALAWLSFYRQEMAL